MEFISTNIVTMKMVNHVVGFVAVLTTMMAVTSRAWVPGMPVSKIQKKEGSLIRDDTDRKYTISRHIPLFSVFTQ